MRLPNDIEKNINEQKRRISEWINLNYTEDIIITFASEMFKFDINKKSIEIPWMETRQGGIAYSVILWAQCAHATVYMDIEGNKSRLYDIELCRRHPNIGTWEYYEPSQPEIIDSIKITTKIDDEYLTKPSDYYNYCLVSFVFIIK